MAPRYGSMAYKGIILVTLVALVAGFLVIRPVGAQDASIDYAENGTDPVATYTGLDPEGRPVYWSLLDVAPGDDNVAVTDTVDFDAFSISDGVLSFKFPPDFETPTSSTLPDNTGTLAARNVYKIVVVASDDALGAAVDDNKAYHKVTVTVTDVDEDGSITLSNQQPQVGVKLTATLADQDTITDPKWKWEHGTALNGPWTVIVGDTAAMETPVAGLVGKYLRATATYTDVHGDDKSAMAVSANAVRAVPGGTNSPPAFPVGSDARSVKENSPLGTDVGKPVAAGDAGDILTYSLTGTGASNYRIDRATGQITVGPRTMLDREALGDPFQHTVTVTATDPSGDPGTVEVTVTVTDVNEAPTIRTGPTRANNQNENILITTVVAAYTASDVDNGDTLVWSLTGCTDASDFNIGNQDGDDVGELTFKEMPNYEKPADADMDNAYMVTVVATDAGTSDDRRIGVDKLTATRDVVIAVMNADDGGTITLSSVQPKVGIDLVATLADEDGVVVDSVKWQWYNETIVDDDLTVGAIAGATSATYTPVAGDTDRTLSVRAAYTDAFDSTNAMKASANAVVADLANRAPEFKNDNDQVITSDTRSVPEDSDAGANIDGVVTATDPNGDSDTLTYTLGGRDASSFSIGSANGQIAVKAGTKLDYDGSKKSYTVTVTATDPSRATATITITINLTDVNEGPVIVDGDEEFVRDFKENSGSTIHTFRATDPEGRPVYWLLSGEAADNEDVLLFSISSTGALKFKSPLPDYENPGDTGTNNSYKVIVVASDDAPGVETDVTSTKKVTITVTNVAEQGSVSVNRRFAQVGVEITATLTDGDATTTTGEIDGVSWQWYSGSTAILGETENTHTPDGDTRTLKVVATYAAKGDTRTAQKAGISVRRMPIGTNSNPAFPSGNAAQERSVAENKPVGTLVGKTIVAIDPDSVDRSKLTYSVAPDTHFSINDSGQLKTKMLLDHEVPPPLTLQVTATDPSGDSGTVEVTVTVTDVNEAPTILTGPTRANNQNENILITTVVATYTASDVDDGDTLVWSLTGTDASDFNIGNQDGDDVGELTFKEMPDFEKPAATRNLYRVTVTVSDGKLKATRAMTVTVTDMPEDGEITLSSVQPKVAVELTASLTDSDGGVKDITWQWARSNTEGGAFANIDGATLATYTPVAADIGMDLRATATYTDKRGEQTAQEVSDNAVIINNDNRAPVFKDANDRVITSDTRSVPENSDAGANIGGPVVATDPNDDNLTYMLSGTDAALFEILTVDDTDGTDKRGQIQVKAGTKLNYEAKNTYMVTVTATDPNGLSDSIDVTIMVTDMDETPEVIVGGLVITGLRAVSYAENGTGNVTPYMAAGRDAASATWSLSGADMGDFMISNTGVLTFRSSPDFETPADADMMNDYEVTVEANDGTNTAMKAVTINVTNVNEDGTVSLSTQQPRVGTAITATLTDADGVVTGTTWQWAKAGTAAGSFDDISGATNASYTPVAADIGMYLRATASYADGYGPGKSAMKVSSSVTDVDEVVTLKDRYDANDNGKIDRDEVLNAIDDFFDPDVSITREQVLDLIDLFFEGLGS